MLLLLLMPCDPALQIGDIPDAEIKPPDNVLFVCKLNPVTEVSLVIFSLCYIENAARL